MYMEIVSIERKTFEAMVTKSTVSSTVWKPSAPAARRKENERVDGQSGRVPDAEHQSAHVTDPAGQRTLAYSQINHKTYYRPQDVQRIVSVVEDRRKEARFKGRTHNLIQ